MFSKLNKSVARCEKHLGPVVENSRRNMSEPKEVPVYMVPDIIDIID